MKAISSSDPLSQLQNLEDVRADRDRKLALAYVRKGKARSAIPEIIRDSGLPMRTVYRAIQRQLAWAEAEFANEEAGSPVKDSRPAISTEPEAEAPVTDSVTQDAASTPHRRSRTA